MYLRIPSGYLKKHFPLADRYKIENLGTKMLPSIIGTSPTIIKIRELINHVADTGLNIVICGESGVGKEVVAQSLYQKSPRM